MNSNLTSIVLGRVGKSGRQASRIIRTVDGRHVLQSYESMAVIQLELTGRPDGIRPGGCESTLESLRTRQHESQGNPININPQEWMELDREYALYQQRRKLAITTAADAHHHGDTVTATRLYRRAAADAWHCLEIIDIAFEEHPAGELSAAKQDARPNLLSQQYMANALVSVAGDNLEMAISCLRTGIEQVCRLLAAKGEQNLANNVCVRDLQMIEQAVLDEKRNRASLEGQLPQPVAPVTMEPTVLPDTIPSRLVQPDPRNIGYRNS